MPREPPTFLTLPLELRLEIYYHLLVLPPPPPRESLLATYRCSFAASRGLGTAGANSKPTLYPQILRVNKQTYEEALPILYGQNTFAAHPVELTARPTLYHPYCSPCRPLATITPVGAESDLKSSLSTHAPAADLQKEVEGAKRNSEAVTNPNIRLIRKWHLRVRLDGPGSTVLEVSPATTTPVHLAENQGADDASPTSVSFPSPATQPITQREGAPTATDVNPIAAAFSNAESLTLDLWRGGFPATSSTSWHGAGATTATTSGGHGDDDDDDDDDEEEEAGRPVALRPFEDVRGVRRVRIVGATAGIERYLSWLQERMTVPPPPPPTTLMKAATPVSGRL
ncbi:hypothetical protein VTH82DRAFT_1935 [Thermothelomyces myriococcoides]